MKEVRRLTFEDLPLIYKLIKQTPTYFGQRADHNQLINIIGSALKIKGQQLFWGLYDAQQGTLLSMLGQRMALRSPTWVENFVYLDKQTTGTYNVRSTGFLDLLDAAIKHAEAEHRYSFLTAFVKQELPTRFKAVSRIIERYSPSHVLLTYTPSTWYAGQGDFADVDYMIGPVPEINKPDYVILQWTKPLVMIHSGPPQN